MRGYGYNDYELLYLIHTGCEEALDVMFKKYQGLKRTNKLMSNNSGLKQGSVMP